MLLALVLEVNNNWKKIIVVTKQENDTLKHFNIKLSKRLSGMTLITSAAWRQNVVNDKIVCSVNAVNIDGVEFTSNVFLKMLIEKCYSKSSHEVIGLHFHRQFTHVCLFSFWEYDSCECRVFMGVFLLWVNIF
ncbi:hypothetical protein KUTeg_002073 [Tegillarca granosa]|uniref:Uncharacterized protein n=1 Tax=Tegillarca granosa TaxID=220873 RepID=A0ABQ9FWG2_TEGGR|nr:hypothetical protein KUTeg_002073 [Tegillarca granosa]